MIVVGAGAVSLLEATAGLPAPLLPPDSGTALGDDGYVLVGGGSSKCHSHDDAISQKNKTAASNVGP